MTGPDKEKRFERGPERRRGESPDIFNNARSAVERRTLDLHWIPLLKGVDPVAALAAIGDSPVMEYQVGDELIRLGQLNDCIFILLSGSLAAHLQSNIREDQTIPIIAGQCIGELSVIDGQPASASVIATTDVRVLKLTSDVFWDRLMVVPGVARNLALTLSERMRRTNARALGVLREQLALEHLRRELDAARQLQISMLPLQRPMFPDRLDLDVCGLMEAASSVGGDFFDVFFLEDDRLFFCLGDVSGHGIASALFMARAVGLIRVLAMTTVEPDRLLDLLNQRLCIGNDSNLFLTMFCAVLDIRSGELQYSNGGHCAPILFTGGRSSLLELPKGPLIGAFAAARYSSRTLNLGVEDLLLCYSDGITEACSGSGEEFSERRCAEIVAALAGQPIPVDLNLLLDALHSAAAEFTGKTDFEDDCTMLALRRLAPARSV
jgi:sigma-B regulation protein RsbU (phosphoserine phosphatase)